MKCIQITVQLFAVEGSMDQTNGIKSFNCFMKTTDDQKTHGLKTKRSIVHANISYRISAQGFQSTFSILVINYLFSLQCVYFGVEMQSYSRSLGEDHCAFSFALTSKLQHSWSREVGPGDLQRDLSS